MLALWEDEETGETEWCEAVVEATGAPGEDWAEVYYYDWDYTDTVLLADLRKRPDKKRSDGGGGRGAQGRTALVPPPADSNPHRAQRESLPAFEHRAEVPVSISSR